MAKRGPKFWEPNAAQIEQVKIASTHHVSVEDICAAILQINPSTYYRYVQRLGKDRWPESDLCKALRVGGAAANVALAGKAYAIATDDTHQRQADMLKFILERKGGFKRQMELTTPAGQPFEVSGPRQPELKYKPDDWERMLRAAAGARAGTKKA